jgi:nucleotidyltransferase/DNA polymerase involved in DNA repair
MRFAAIYVPDFPVEAMVRAEPELREQAVAVVEGTPPLVHVVAVNERAAQAGVEPGMTRLQAEERLVDDRWSMAGSELRVASCEKRQSEIDGKIPTLSRPQEGRDKGGATASGFAGEGPRATKSHGSETRATQARATRMHGTVRQRSAEREAAAHAALLDCACGFSPRVEDTAADTVVLDLAGLERIFGPPAKMARDVARRCSEMGLEANVAVASNADTAALAARGFAGVTVIAEGKEAERLGELGVVILLATGWGEALPIADDRVSGRSGDRAIGNPAQIARSFNKGERAPAALEILETLERWGVRNLRALAALPEVALAERLGQEGLRLQKLARGETRRPLVVAEPPLVFEEAAELEDPVDVLEPLAFLLNRMLEQLCARLAARALATNELRVTLELQPSTEDRVIGRSGDRVIEKPAQITGSPEYQMTRCLRLPVPMLDAKVFLKLLQLDLQAHPPPAPVTKVWLRAEPTEPRRAQNGLFVSEAPEAERLELTIARIKKVVGTSCESRVPSCGQNPHPISPPRYASGQAPPGEIRVGQPRESCQSPGASRQEKQQAAIENRQCSSEARVGSPEIVDTHRADGWRMKAFAASGQWAVASGQENQQSTMDALGGERAPTSMVALRVFRPALAAVVTVREGKPAQVASAERPTMRGEVVWCAGPWRSSGEWWTEQAWSREEWDVAVRNEEGVALYRVYRDESKGKWWVEGSYD